VDLKSRIRTIPDWPVAGIQFRDITTLLQDPEAFRHVCRCFAERYRDVGLDKIAAIDARGFIFGGVLAHELNLGLVPVRKSGKLPADTVSADYALEYGNNSVEIHCDAVARGERVLIVDDLIATGGTAQAAARLVQQLGGEVHELAFVVELPDLGGRQALAGYSVFSLVSFAGD